MNAASTIERFDALSESEARILLAPCCASSRWQQIMIEGRPYGSGTAVLAAGDAALAGLSDGDVHQALAAHPRIGRAIVGTGVESEWSRAEQRAADSASPDVSAALRDSNVAYEDRFGHVFLIRASGRSSERMLAELRRRLGQDPATEWAEVREQLRQIVRLRLARALGLDGGLELDLSEVHG